MGAAFGSISLDDVSTFELSQQYAVLNPTKPINVLKHLLLHTANACLQFYNRPQSIVRRLQMYISIAVHVQFCTHTVGKKNLHTVVPPCTHTQTHTHTHTHDYKSHIVSRTHTTSASPPPDLPPPPPPPYPLPCPYNALLGKIIAHPKDSISRRVCVCVCAMYATPADVMSTFFFTHTHTHTLTHLGTHM